MIDLETMLREQLVDLESKVELRKAEQEIRIADITEQVNDHNQWMAKSRQTITAMQGGIETIHFLLHKLETQQKEVE